MTRQPVSFSEATSSAGRTAHPAREAPEGCWESMKQCLGLSRTVIQRASDVLAFATLFVDPNSVHGKNMRLAQAIMSKTSKGIKVLEDGSIQLPDGSVIGSSLWAVLSEHAQKFTDDSTALAYVVIESLLRDAAGNQERQLTATTRLIHLVTLLAEADIPTTPIMVGFDGKTGLLYRMTEGHPQPLGSTPLFDEDTSKETRAFLTKCFEEFVPVYQDRTRKETDSGGTRIEGALLPQDGHILRAYAHLREANPLYKAITFATQPPILEMDR